MFDKNGNGRISMAELGEMMTNLGKNVPSKVNKNFGAVFSESLWLYGYMGETGAKRHHLNRFQILTAGARRYSGGA